MNVMEHYGCPADQLLHVVYLIEYIHLYLGHKIGCGGPRTWAAHSPDLTPLENMPHYISDECAAMNPQGSRSSNDCNSALN